MENHTDTKLPSTRDEERLVVHRLMGEQHKGCGKNLRWEPSDFGCAVEKDALTLMEGLGKRKIAWEIQ